MFTNALVNYVSWNIYMAIVVSILRECGGGGLGIFIGIITPLYRFTVFEVIYKSIPYISVRPSEKPCEWYNIYKLIRLGNVISLGLVSYVIVPMDDIVFRYISISDVYKCILSFFVTDILFYCSHRTMHNRFVYNTLGHQEHHKLHKPTSHMIIENFTLTDGMSHVVVFYVNYMLMRQIFHIDAFLVSLMYSQWVIIGQLQHGGKDIQLDSIPFLEYIRSLFVKDTMCLLHDKHHSLYNKNYSMTGIPDKVFGTISS